MDLKELKQKTELQIATVTEMLAKTDDKYQVEKLQSVRRFLVGFKNDLKALENSSHESAALPLHGVSNNEAGLDCDYDLHVKVPFKTKKYRMKVISEVAVCPKCGDDDIAKRPNNEDMFCWNCAHIWQTDC